MITCQLSGGLGNQLFQVFTTLAYSIQYNISVMFEYTNETTEYITAEGIKMRHTYWNTFFIHIINLTTYSLPQNSLIDIVSFFPYKEPHFHYAPLPKEISTRNMKLVGYYQSYKYFHEKKKYIFKLLKIQKLQEMVQKIYEIDTNSVAMHFRLGDYQYHESVHPILNLDYYKKALDSIVKKRGNCKVLYFCEEDISLQINILKEEFANCIFTKIDDTISDWEQLLLMSCCRDNIIANSTFSWWGAYLGNQEDRIVCYPKKWFSDDKITRDMFLPTWDGV